MSGDMRSSKGNSFRCWTDPTDVFRNYMQADLAEVHGYFKIAGMAEHPAVKAIETLIGDIEASVDRIETQRKALEDLLVASGYQIENGWREDLSKAVDVAAELRAFVPVAWEATVVDDGISVEWWWETTGHRLFGETVARVMLGCRAQNCSWTSRDAVRSVAAKDAGRCPNCGYKGFPANQRIRVTGPDHSVEGPSAALIIATLAEYVPFPTLRDLAPKLVALEAKLMREPDDAEEE